MRRISLFVPAIALLLVAASPPTAPASPTRATHAAMAAPLAPHVTTIELIAAPAAMILPSCAMPIAVRVVTGSVVDTLSGIAIILACPRDGIAVDSLPDVQRAPRAPLDSTRRSYRHDGDGAIRPPNSGTRSRPSLHRYSARYS